MLLGKIIVSTCLNCYRPTFHLQPEGTGVMVAEQVPSSNSRPFRHVLEFVGNCDSSQGLVPHTSTRTGGVPSVHQTGRLHGLHWGTPQNDNFNWNNADKTKLINHWILGFQIARDNLNLVCKAKDPDVNRCRTTCCARTSLQPQLNKARKRRSVSVFSRI